MVRIAAVEGGGTTWVAAICENEASNVVAKQEFKTQSPSDTLESIRSWLNTQCFDCIGVATFGPVDANRKSPKYGFITSTPKPGWANTDVLKLLGIRDDFKNVPFEFDTDVNAPALVEFDTRRGRGITSSAYITVGTGVGVGLVINGQSVHGLMHPEAGHLLSGRKTGDVFEGTCPFHGCCIEGMCSTGALAKRKGCTAEELPALSDEDPLWQTCAYYIAQLCVSLVLTTSVEHIAIGGGVLNRTILYSLVREHTIDLLAGYVENEVLTKEHIDSYITEPVWGSLAGLVGAAHLGLMAHNKHVDGTMGSAENSRSLEGEGSRKHRRI